MNSTEQTTRPDWTTMRAQDFDTDVPLTLFDIPAQPITEGGEATLF